MRQVFAKPSLIWHKDKTNVILNKDYTYWSAWCLVVHKASTGNPDFKVSADSAHTSPQDHQPFADLSFSIIVCHIVCVFHFLFLQGSEDSAILQSLFGFCLNICLIILHLLHCTWTLKGSTETHWSSSTIFTWSCHLILKYCYKIGQKAGPIVLSMRIRCWQSLYNKWFIKVFDLLFNTTIQMIIGHK